MYADFSRTYDGTRKLIQELIQNWTPARPTLWILCSDFIRISLKVRNREQALGRDHRESGGPFLDLGWTEKLRIGENSQLVITLCHRAANISERLAVCFCFRSSTVAANGCCPFFNRGSTSNPLHVGRARKQHSCNKTLTQRLHFSCSCIRRTHPQTAQVSLCVQHWTQLNCGSTAEYSLLPDPHPSINPVRDKYGRV